MKVVIYRPDSAAQDNCAVALLGTAKWAVSELLLTIGMDLDSEGEPIAVDPGDPWAAVALEEPGVGDPSPTRLENSDPDYTGHALGTIVLILPAWNAGGPLPEVLGDGWWRFLTPQGEDHILHADEGEEGAVAAPAIWLERKGAGGVACDPATPTTPPGANNPAEASLLLREGGSGERIAGLHFMVEAPLDATACAILQSLGEVLRIAGVALHRVRESPESPVERLSVSLLLRDSM